MYCEDPKNRLCSETKKEGRDEMSVHRMTNLSVMEAKELLDSYVTGVTPLVPCKVGDVLYELVNENAGEVSHHQGLPLRRSDERYR